MRVAVIGASGGMGKFFSRYFLSRGDEVTGADPAPSGIRAKRFKQVRSNLEAVDGADVVVLATPVEKTVEVAEEVSHRLKPGTCLIELTSVKGKVLGPLRRAVGASGVELLSLHPLFGPSLSSSKGMKICVIETPGEEGSEARAVRLFPDARIIPLEEMEHDKMMGLMLSLTHLMNIAYAGVVARYLSPGEFRKLETPTASVQLSLAEGVLSQDPGLYSYIQIENEFSLEFADALIDELVGLRRIVAGGRKRRDRRGFEAVYAGIAQRYSGDSKTSLRGVYDAFEKRGRAAPRTTRAG